MVGVKAGREGLAMCFHAVCVYWAPHVNTSHAMLKRRSVPCYFPLTLYWTMSNPCTTLLLVLKPMCEERVVADCQIPKLSSVEWLAEYCTPSLVDWGLLSDDQPALLAVQIRGRVRSSDKHRALGSCAMW